MHTHHSESQMSRFSLALLCSPPAAPLIIGMFPQGGEYEEHARIRSKLWILLRSWLLGTEKGIWRQDPPWELRQDANGSKIILGDDRALDFPRVDPKCDMSAHRQCIILWRLLRAGFWAPFVLSFWKRKKKKKSWVSHEAFSLDEKGCGEDAFVLWQVAHEFVPCFCMRALLLGNWPWIPAPSQGRHALFLPIIHRQAISYEVLS